MEAGLACLFLLAAVIFAFQPSVLAGDKNLQNRAVEVRALILHDLKEETHYVR